MASLSLVFDILARDNASGAFNNVGNSAERAGKKGKSAGDLIGASMKAAGGLLLGAGLVEGFKSLYEGAAESAKITAITQQVIKSTGRAANLSASQIGDLSGAISAKTGVDDEAIQSGANLLLTFTNIKDAAGEGNDIFSQTTQIMTDMSVALGQDASGSAMQLGKALNDPIKGVSSLAKVGVSFTEQQKDQIRTMVEAGDVAGAQGVILAELGRQFGGAAEAAATPVDKLKVNVGNLAETAGAYLIPAVNEVADFILDELIPALSDGTEWVGENFGGAFELAADAMGGMVSLGQNVAGFFAAIPGPVQAGVVALGAFILLRGPLVSMFNTVALRAMYMADAVSTSAARAATARGAMSGLAGFLGGPWGLAVAGATIGLGYLITSMDDSSDVSEQAETAQQDFAAAVRESNGAINESVRAAAAKAAQDSGLLKVADDLGLSLPQVTDAVLGNKAAYDQLNVRRRSTCRRRFSALAATRRTPTSRVPRRPWRASGAGSTLWPRLSSSRRPTSSSSPPLRRVRTPHWVPPPRPPRRSQRRWKPPHRKWTRRSDRSTSSS